jgi:beta-lactamase class A
MRGHVVAVAVLLALLTACSSGPPAGPVPSASADQCVPWGCEQQARFEAASAFMAAQSGHVGIVVRDRVTGAVWRGGDPSLRSWAGSTPKLALAVALKEQARAGTITLSQADVAGIDAMLHVSDNAAADQLWNRYASSASMMSRWQTLYGMTTASYVDGWTNRWGFVKLAPQDLVNLMSYVLEKLNAEDRAWIVDRMRAVGPPQQWGVWGAGTGLQPGVKDGWDYCVEIGESIYRWVTSTVGFVGPDERYVVAAMYDDAPGQQIDHGVHVLTDIVATVFGSTVPASVTVPADV